MATKDFLLQTDKTTPSIQPATVAPGSNPATTTPKNWTDVANETISNWQNEWPSIEASQQTSNARQLRQAEGRSAAMGKGFGGAFQGTIAQSNLLGQQALQKTKQAWNDKGTQLNQWRAGLMAQTEEAEKGREFQKSERLGSQGWQSGEAATGRSWQSGERVAGQDFTAGQNQLGRDFNSTEADEARQFEGDQGDLNRDQQTKGWELEFQTPKDAPPPVPGAVGQTDFDQYIPGAGFTANDDGTFKFTDNDGSEATGSVHDISAQIYKTTNGKTDPASTLVKKAWSTDRNLIVSLAALYARDHDGAYPYPERLAQMLRDTGYTG